MVVDPNDYARLLDELDRESGPSTAFRFELARRAFAHTAVYDSAIASTLGGVRVEGEQFARLRPSTSLGVP